ncbi:MAG: penicillin-binding protein [Bacteroidetes bacterium]|nr:penicillin-binding protein [Bacteroidota bacterium]
MDDNTVNNKKYIIWFWALFASPFVVLFLIFFLISEGVMGPIPSFEELENPDNKLAAEVYSEDNVLLGKYFIQNRTWTEYEEISPYMIDALISTEDIRFYRHSGIDVRGLVRVAVKRVLLRQKQAGGGSTITQQLAKNLYQTRSAIADSEGARKSFNLGMSKFKEWYTAVKLEKSYTKEEIITMYLNQFDFVNNAVGIRSAAQVYFNTTPDSLGIEQSAMLVGMLKNSSYFNPVRRPEATRQRRNVVLSQMVKYGYLGREAGDSLKQADIVLNFREASHTAGLATYFREYIRTTMIAYNPDSLSGWSTEEAYDEAKYQWDNNPLYGWCRKNHKPDGSNYNLYNDGLKIYTTINSKMQQYAEEALVNHLDSLIQPAFYKAARRFRNPPFSDDITPEEIRSIMETSMRRTDRYRSMQRLKISSDSIMKVFNTPVPMRLFSYEGIIDTVMTPMDSIRYYKFFVRSSFMAMDPHTGGVKAYIGGPNFNYIKFDAVTAQKKQVGSTIKPFLYTIAMQNGISPCHEVSNVPYEFTVADSIWRPRSSGPGEYHGKMVTLKWGLAQSENYISAWLMKQFSPGAVADLMQRMGIRSYVPEVPSIFLGTADLSLEEMVGAYGTYSNKGVYTQPIYVTRIEDRNGNVISRFTPGIEEVLTEEQAYLMANLLMGVVQTGSGIRLRATYQLMNQIGGKTGTTQNHANGWFMGITPNLVAGVWTGWEDQAIHFEDLRTGQGANMALPVFAEFLKRVYADPEFSMMVEDTFEAPPGFTLELDCDKLKSQKPGSTITRQRY